MEGPAAGVLWVQPVSQCWRRETHTEGRPPSRTVHLSPVSRRQRPACAVRPEDECRCPGVFYTHVTFLHTGLAFDLSRV